MFVSEQLFALANTQKALLLLLINQLYYCFHVFMARTASAQKVRFPCKSPYKVFGLDKRLVSGDSAAAPLVKGVGYA